MTTTVEDYTTERICIMTPASRWVPIAYDLVDFGNLRGTYDELLENNPEEFTITLSRIFRCDVSVEKKTQITARFE